MTINILHLYYDLLNLYGEIGNIKALVNSLEQENIKVTVDKLSINDNIDFDKYDFIYMGSGTEENQMIVLEDIIKYKNQIKKYIDRDKFFLATGNSYELFGKSIYDEKKHISLGIFDYNASKSNNRLVGDTIVKCDFINAPIIGFQNQSGIIKDNSNPMFKVISGIGSFNGSTCEGINYNNFYGTYLLGPILVRNPEFHKYIVEKLIKNKYPKFKLKKLNLDVDTKAYEIYMNKYHKEI